MQLRLIPSSSFSPAGSGLARQGFHTRGRSQLELPQHILPYPLGPPRRLLLPRRPLAHLHNPQPAPVHGLRLIKAQPQPVLKGVLGQEAVLLLIDEQQKGQVLQLTGELLVRDASEEEPNGAFDLLDVFWIW